MAHVGIQITVEQQVTINTMRDAIVEVINSHHFDVLAIREQKLTVSQAYCLLWQNSETGKVFGRQVCIELLGGAAAACILDLIVMGKVEIEVKPSKVMGVNTKDVLLKVTDATPTGTYLDKAIFDEILEYHQKNPEDPKKLKNWILKDLWKMTPKDRCATVTLDSLAEMGILDKKESTFSIKYPTAVQGPEENLIRELNRIGLEEAEPNSFMRALLTLMRAIDNIFCLWDPLLKKCFPKDQYSKAKERIKALVQVDTNAKQKYEAMD